MVHGRALWAGAHATAFGALAASVLAVAACGSSSSRSSSDAASAKSLTGAIEQRLDAADLLPPLYRTVHEAMPSTAFKVAGKPGLQYVSDLFVAGTVESVDPGGSFAWPNGPQIVGQPSTAEQLPFNAASAKISDITLLVSVSESVSRSAALRGLKKVKIGIALSSPANLDAARAEYPAGTKIAAILLSNEKTTFTEDASTFGVVGYGQLLGTVDTTGTAKFPAWYHSDQSAEDNPDGISLTELVQPIAVPVNGRTP
jgi:hypothetical protein